MNGTESGPQQPGAAPGGETAPHRQEIDRLSILARREIEAAVLAPLVAAFRKRFGDDAVLPILADVIRTLAREHGRQLADRTCDRSLRGFAGIWEPWTRGGALELEPIETSDRALAFNVTRCRYAELYRAMGIAELGRYLSCGRDAALVEGFNPAIRLTRTQTIMEGAPYCDFRYRLEAPAGPADPAGPAAPEPPAAGETPGAPG